MSWFSRHCFLCEHQQKNKQVQKWLHQHWDASKTFNQPFFAPTIIILSFCFHFMIDQKHHRGETVNCSINWFANFQQCSSFCWDDNALMKFHSQNFFLIACKNTTMEWKMKCKMLQCIVMIPLGSPCVRDCPFSLIVCFISNDKTIRSSHGWDSIQWFFWIVTKLKQSILIHNNHQCVHLTSMLVLFCNYVAFYGDNVRKRKWCASWLYSQGNHIPFIFFTFRCVWFT